MHITRIPLPGASRSGPFLLGCMGVSVRGQRRGGSNTHRRETSGCSQAWAVLAFLVLELPAPWALLCMRPGQR